ncbi:MAG: 3'-5' exonuclease [Clostridia bacterium]
MEGEESIVKLLNKSIDFVAIDFETANGKASSACSLGLAIVSNGQVVDNPSWLIRPSPLYFEYWNTKIHGINTNMVKDQPSFRELWPEIYVYLENRILVAHSVTFDIKVLYSSLGAHFITAPPYEYACSLKVSRKVWPYLERHGLDSVARYLGLDFNHHDAKEDAYASAIIMIEAAKALEASNMYNLYKKIGYHVTTTY